ERIVRVTIPPLIRTGAVIEGPLSGLGIHNLYLRLHLRVGERGAAPLGAVPRTDPAGHSRGADAYADARRHLAGRHDRIPRGTWAGSSAPGLGAAVRGLVPRRGPNGSATRR